MATITSTFRLQSLSYTDILNISIAPTLTVGDPTESGTITTTSSTDQEIIDRAHAKDTFVFVRNTGTTTTDGNILVTDDDGTPNNISLLKPGEFLFIPWAGNEDIDVTTSATNMAVEYMIISEA